MQGGVCVQKGEVRAEGDAPAFVYAVWGLGVGEGVRYANVWLAESRVRRRHTFVEITSRPSSVLWDLLITYTSFSGVLPFEK